MKDILNKFNVFYNSNKQKVTLFGGIFLVMILIIVAIFVAVKIVGVKISYEKLENKLEKAAYKYLSENPGELPNSSNPTVVVSANTLIENKYIKELKKYVKDSSCTANVLVHYVNNDYKYQAYLTCKSFKTEKFSDVLKSNNNIVSIRDGLYEINQEYVYRGDNPNNYVSFADRIWRIVKINKNGDIIL